jgi:hypothetical protein
MESHITPSGAGRLLRGLGSPDYRRRPFGLAALRAVCALAERFASLGLPDFRLLPLCPKMPDAPRLLV